MPVSVPTGERDAVDARVVDQRRADESPVPGKRCSTSGGTPASCSSLTARGRR